MRRSIVKLNGITVAFTVIGISSHENDYRLSWSINEQLGYSFRRGESFFTHDGNEFTCFAYKDEDRTLKLISNRCDDGFLLGKYRNLDFILKFETMLNETEISVWLRNLRKVPLLSAAFPIPINRQILQLLG